jgi:putative ABC transport system permease protein
MVSPRWRKAVGDLRAHRGRTLLATLAIAAGLAGAGTVLNAWALVKVATRDGFLAADPPAATLHVDSVTPTLLARVRSVPGVRLAEGRRTISGRVTIEGTSYRAQLFVLDDPASSRIGRVIQELGDWPPADDAFTIERSSLDFSGASLGGELRLTLGDAPPRDLRITGIARDVTLAPGWMEHLVYGFVSRAALRAMGLPDAPDELRVVTADRTLDQAGVQRIALAVRDTVRAAGQRVTDLDVPVPGEHVHAAQMDSLLYTQGAFGLLALLCSAFLVVNLITAMLAGQVREIGILKTLGGSTGQIARLYLAVAAALGVASVALALPVAMLAGREYAALKASLLNFDLTGVSLPVWVIALQVGAGILLPVVAALPPVRRGCGLSVAEALRDVGITEGASAPALLHRLEGFDRPLLLSLRNAFRRRQRLLLTLLALSAAGAVFIGARNLRRAVIGATDLLFAAQRYDFSVRLVAPADPDSLSAVVRGIEGVEAAEAWTGATAYLDRDGGMPGDGIPITAAPVGSALLVAQLLEGRALGAGDDRGIVIGRAMVRRMPELGVGSRLRLSIAGTTDEWSVVGIAEAGPTPSAYATREAIMALNGTGTSTVVVRAAVRGEAAQLALIGQLRGALGERGYTVASSARLVESRRVMEDHLLMVVDMLGAMGWLMLVVGGLGLASAMAIAVLERTREIGVLRAIGARDATLMRLVVVEGLAMGLMGWALALPLSVPVSLALGEAFGRIMVPVAARAVPDGAAVLWWLGLVVVISVVASAWPARRAARVPAARALSYE